MGIGVESLESNRPEIQKNSDPADGLRGEAFPSYENPYANRTTSPEDSKRNPKGSATDREGGLQGQSEEKPELREAPPREGRDLPPVRPFFPPVRPDHPIDNRNKPTGAVDETITFTNPYM